MKNIIQIEELFLKQPVAEDEALQGPGAANEDIETPAVRTTKTQQPEWEFEQGKERMKGLHIV